MFSYYQEKDNLDAPIYLNFIYEGIRFSKALNISYVSDDIIEFIEYGRNWNSIAFDEFINAIKLSGEGHYDFNVKPYDGIKCTEKFLEFHSSLGIKSVFYYPLEENSRTQIVNQFMGLKELIEHVIDHKRINYLYKLVN